MPRHDERKERLKLTIRSVLLKSKSYEDFEKKMQAQGYKIIKGRGISFIDNKKVKIKGSEVGYSLQKIQQRLEFQHPLKTDKEFFKQVNERRPLANTTEVKNASMKSKNIFCYTTASTRCF